MATPYFGRSVNPISTRGTDYAHVITTGTPGLSDLPTALLWCVFMWIFIIFNSFIFFFVSGKNFIMTIMLDCYLHQLQKPNEGKMKCDIAEHGRQTVWVVAKIWDVWNNSYHAFLVQCKNRKFRYSCVLSKDLHSAYR